ncbi:hypothetical protein, partial [Dickeya dadantii]|uniref:hypothetical protein n=1 Tax=Dickeya dadantii TaxID=204038 RepID=UPI001C12FA6C
PAELYGTRQRVAVQEPMGLIVDLQVGQILLWPATLSVRLGLACSDDRGYLEDQEYSPARICVF